MEANKIILGDSFTVLKTLPDECIDMIITSPPYFGLRDYNVQGQLGLEKSLGEYLKKMLEITAELKRVLKSTGTCWINMGDCYSSAGKVGGDFGKQGKVTKSSSGRARTTEHQEKSLLMQPERLVIAMCDEQDGGNTFVLREDLTKEEKMFVVTELAKHNLI